MNLKNEYIKSNKMHILFFVSFLYIGNYMAMHGASYTLNKMPGNIALVNMKKTVNNNVIESIDFLFKGNDSYYFYQFFLSTKTGNPYSVDISQISDSINCNGERGAAQYNDYVQTNNLKSSFYGIKELHKSPIKKICFDYNNNLLVTQSDYKNIRLWKKNSFGQGLETLQEIDRAFLIEYIDSNMIWARKSFFNKNILNIYVGFSFITQEKNFFNKNEIYDFVKKEEIMSIPYINDGYLPPCFLSKHYAAVFDEQKKEITIITYTEKKEKSITNKEKTVGSIEKETIFLKNIEPSKANENKEQLLYRVPKKIAYDKNNKKIVLLYDDRFIVCGTTQYTSSYVTKTDEYIVDGIIHDYQHLYVLIYNKTEMQYKLLIYNV